MLPALTLAALVAASMATFAATPPAPPAGWTEHYVFANSLRIHYWRTGGTNLPVMIVAHGSSDDGLCWTNFVKELTANYDIILYDARGHGLSDPPPIPNPVDGQIEDLAALIRALNVQKPILMGHSMGSASVAGFAARYPDIPRAVILEDPGLGARRPPMPSDPEALAKRREATLAGNNKTFDTLFQQCMTSSPKWGESECAYWAPSKMRHHPNMALPTAGERTPMDKLLPKITAPTLILKADAQGDLRKENEAAARLLPNGKLVHIEGAGHNVRRENKAQALAELKAFLANVRSSTEAPGQPTRAAAR